MNEINQFIEPIVLKRKKHDFKAWRKYKSVMKMCKKLAPSFKIMCDISEFINLLRSSYMYSNFDGFHLFVGSIPKGRTAINTCSMFYEEKDKFTIAYVLYKENKQINIEIKRNGKNSSDKEIISFKDGEYQFKDVYDQEKFLFMTSCLMSGVCELLEYYYKNKKF